MYPLYDIMAREEADMRRRKLLAAAERARLVAEADPAPAQRSRIFACLALLRNVPRRTRIPATSRTESAEIISPTS